MIFSPIFHILRELVGTYGLAGLFAESFIVSTIFVPFNVEFAFPILLASGVQGIPILIVATLGSVAGTLVNYYIGLKGIKLAHRYIKDEKIEKATHMMNRYGWAGLLAVVTIPVFPVDPITVLCGATKMNIKEFTAAVTIGKLLKYAIILDLTEMAIRAAGF